MALFLLRVGSPFGAFSEAKESGIKVSVCNYSKKCQHSVKRFVLIGEYLENVNFPLALINVKIDAIIEGEDVTPTVPLTSPDVNSIWTFIKAYELMFVPEHRVLLAGPTKDTHNSHINKPQMQPSAMEMTIFK